MTIRTVPVFCLLCAVSCLVLSACAEFKLLSRADKLTPDEKLEYVILQSVAPDAAATYLNASTSAARADFLDWFWRSSDFARGKDSAAHRRYRERASQARTFYGSNDLMGDDRVRAYVHYGPPRRETFQPIVRQSDTLHIAVEPAEIWTYESLGIQLDFVKTGVPFKLVGTSQYGPEVSASAFEEVDLGRAVPQSQADAVRLGLEMSLGRLSQSGDSVDVELQYGIPVEEVASSFPTGQPLFHITVEFTPHGKGMPVREAGWFGTRVPENPKSGPRLVVARRTFRLPADIYTVTVAIVTVDGKAAATRSRELNLIDYVRKAQPASDVLFYSLADSTFQSPQFAGSGWRRLVPLVVPSLRSGSTCYILYELYNLATDSAGRHRLEADYDFIEESTRQLAIPATPTRFISGMGAQTTVVERVHTMNLRPGEYLVVARVRDMADDRRISLTAKLRIEPR